MTDALDSRVQLTATLAALTSTLMIAQQIASKSLRDALFLQHFDVESLPMLVVVSAGLSLLMVLAMGRVMRRIPPARLMPAMFFVSGALYSLEWVGSAAYPTVVAVTVYVHTVTFGASAVSGFWSVINERFDPFVAKQVIGRIAGGATLGGLLGGLAVWQVAPHIELETLLLVLASVNGVCAILLARVASGVVSARPTPDEQAPAPSIVASVRKTPYLAYIGSFILLLALGTTLFDYVFKAQAAARYSESSALVTFFALFYTVTGVSTFVVQGGLVRRVLVKLGLGPTIAVLPGSIFVFGLGATLFPGFISATLLRGVAATAENSFHRSGYELLYTPLPPRTKRASKLFIDVGADRLGTALGSAGVLLLLLLDADVALVAMLALATLLALGMVAVLVRLHRGYVGALAESMRSGHLEAGGLEAERADRTLDAATAQQAIARTLVGEALGPTLSTLRATASSASLGSSTGERSGLHRLRQSLNALAEAPREPAGPRTQAPPPLIDEGEDVTLALVEHLRSGDPARVRRALSHPRSRALMSHTLPLLDDAELAPIVLPVLRREAPRIVGQLVDTLSRARTSLTVHAHVAAVLSQTPTERAAEGLTIALRSSTLLRAHAGAAALLALTSRYPHLSRQRTRVFGWVREALERASSSAKLSDLPGALPASPFRDLGEGVVPAFHAHVFTLLALHLPLDPLEHAFLALHRHDDPTRGAALEYLENVLPLDLRRPLLRMITERPSAPLDATKARELGEQLAERDVSLSELRELARTLT
ncbi:MAG: hypothetical protein AB8I08_40085 [Sandaracinaceae bacterium]